MEKYIERGEVGVLDRGETELFEGSGLERGLL